MSNLRTGTITFINETTKPLTLSNAIASEGEILTKTLPIVVSRNQSGTVKTSAKDPNQGVVARVSFNVQESADAACLLEIENTDFRLGTSIIIGKNGKRKHLPAEGNETFTQSGCIWNIVTRLNNLDYVVQVSVVKA